MGSQFHPFLLFWEDLAGWVTQLDLCFESLLYLILLYFLNNFKILNSPHFMLYTRELLYIIFPVLVSFLNLHFKLLGQHKLYPSL